jgi:hypothetical protein
MGGRVAAGAAGGCCGGGVRCSGLVCGQDCPQVPLAEDQHPDLNKVIQKDRRGHAMSGMDRDRSPAGLAPG